jgi:hypothetical protein
MCPAWWAMLIPRRGTNILNPHVALSPTPTKKAITPCIAWISFFYRLSSVARISCDKAGDPGALQAGTTTATVS